MQELYNLNINDLKTLVYGVLNYYEEKIKRQEEVIANLEDNASTEEIEAYREYLRITKQERKEFLEKIGYNLRDIKELYQIEEMEEVDRKKIDYLEKKGLEEFGKKYFHSDKASLKILNKTTREIMKNLIGQREILTQDEFDNCFYEAVVMGKSLTEIWPDKEPSKRSMLRSLRRVQKLKVIKSRKG